MCVRRSCLVLNVGRADWSFNRDLADAVASILGGVSVSVDSDAAPDTRSYGVDFCIRDRLPRTISPVSLSKMPSKGWQSTLLKYGGLSPEFRTSNRIRLRRHQVLTAAGFLDEELHWRKR